MLYTIKVAGLSDTGLVRDNNEDFWGEAPDILFYALADGMGGHQAGEVASREAITVLCKSMKKALIQQKNRSVSNIQDIMRHAIEEANSAVYQLGSSHEQLTGMGTTVCCLKFINQMAVYGHVGDSRIYRFRKDTLELLTSDHSLLKELIDLGQLGQHQVADFLYKNILTRAVGTEMSVDSTIGICDITDGDLFMMCTDGLSDLIFQEEMEAIMKQTSVPEKILQNLIQAAKDKGGYDNITAVIMQVIKKKDEKPHLSR